MNIYNRMLNAGFANEILEKKKYVFLYANIDTNGNGEKRGQKIKKELNPTNYFEIEYFNAGVSAEGKIQEGFKMTGSDGTTNEYRSLRRNDMEKFLSLIYSVDKCLVLDFTLMNTRLLGSLCSLLYKYDWEEVFFCYTEPGDYRKNENDDYDLNNTTMGFDQIPGLESFSDSSDVCDWVVFLGFEGSRLMRLEEEAPASRRFSIPHISIPAMKTKWHNIAMNTNTQFFELKINNHERIEYVSAINPFETYDKLNSLKEGNRDIRLVVSPIGPKPVILGCIMYILEFEDDMLLFDNPYQEGSNTDEFGSSHFYDLSEFVRVVKNKRYDE